MEVCMGRPTDSTARLVKEMRVYDLLDRLDIRYRRVDHPAAMTMDDCTGADEALGVQMCKNLFLCNRQKTAFYLLLMPGAKPFHTKELSGQLGVARLSFADAEAMEKYLNITPGAVSVMGLMNDCGNHVRLLIDRDLLTAADFGCHPCVNTSSLRLTTVDLLTKFLPAVHHDYTQVSLSAAE